MKQLFKLRLNVFSTKMFSTILRENLHRDSVKFFEFFIQQFLRCGDAAVFDRTQIDFDRTQIDFKRTQIDFDRTQIDFELIRQNQIHI